MDVFVSKSTNIEFKQIPAGSFTMGAMAWELPSPKESEMPQHEVRINGFYLGVTPVTMGQWNAVMGNTLPVKNDDLQCPAHFVSYNDAIEFIARLNALEGRPIYRLPTEAEWEYAARAGTKTTYYWGSILDKNAVWYKENSNDRPQPVKTRPPNPFGLYDMIGNVDEWIADYYAKNYYKKSPEDNPKGPGTGTHKVLRGGNYHCSYNELTCWRRIASSALKAKTSSNGFRIAADL